MTSGGLRELVVETRVGPVRQVGRDLVKQAPTHVPSASAFAPAIRYLRVEIKILRRVHGPRAHRRGADDLVDGVAVPVPHHSTEPAEDTG